MKLFKKHIELNDEQINLLGTKKGRMWEAFGKRRIYFHPEVLLKLQGYRWSKYKTGNVSGAMLNGTRISNSAMNKKLAEYSDEKFYYDLVEECFVATINSSKWFECLGIDEPQPKPIIACSALIFEPNLKLTDQQYTSLALSGLSPINHKLEGLAEACYEQSCFNDLFDCTIAEVDEYDMYAWGINEQEWRLAQKQALETAMYDYRQEKYG